MRKVLSLRSVSTENTENIAQCSRGLGVGNVEFVTRDDCQNGQIFSWLMLVTQGISPDLRLTYDKRAWGQG